MTEFEPRRIIITAICALENGEASIEIARVDADRATIVETVLALTQTDKVELPRFYGSPQIAEVVGWRLSWRKAAKDDAMGYSPIREWDMKGDEL